MMIRCTTIGLLFLCTATFGQSARAVNEFSAVDVTNDGTISLSQFNEEKGVVVIFRGNECPFDGYYNQRIAELVHSYKDRIPFLLVNPYLEPPEAADRMKMYATVWSLGVPYVADKDQIIMESLGARRTPEAFLLKNRDGKFTIVFSGAIDDNPQLPAGVKQKYLETAINDLLTDKTAGTTSVRATGCTIRKR